MRHPETRRFSAEGGISRGAHREFMVVGCGFRGGDKPAERQGKTCFGEAAREIPRPAGENAGLRDDAAP